jgi:hypothetical protein
MVIEPINAKQPLINKIAIVPLVAKRRKDRHPSQMAFKMEREKYQFIT